jgi:hypothetical protein
MARGDVGGMFAPFETMEDYKARARAMKNIPAVGKITVSATIVGLYESSGTKRCLNGDEHTLVEFVEFRAKNGNSMLIVHVPEHCILVVVGKEQVSTQDCPLVHRGSKKRVPENLLGVFVPCFYNNSACALEVLWQGKAHFLRQDKARD